jgi:hypothetical protein
MLSPTCTKIFIYTEWKGSRWFPLPSTHPRNPPHLPGGLSAMSTAASQSECGDPLLPGLLSGVRRKQSRPDMVTCLYSPSFSTDRDLGISQFKASPGRKLEWPHLKNNSKMLSMMDPQIGGSQSDVSWQKRKPLPEK